MFLLYVGNVCVLRLPSLITHAEVLFYEFKHSEGKVTLKLEESRCNELSILRSQLGTAARISRYQPYGDILFQLEHLVLKARRTLRTKDEALKHFILE